MQHIHHRYPDAEVWVVLDQDGAHPRKSKMTRQVTRELHPHGISLPKASPDDNAVETIFSDVQLMVQDNSDDPDERNMRKRISHRLTRRNRVSDRFIEIPYLRNSHKG
jgi:transposase